MSDRISVITIEKVGWQADWTPNVEEFNGVTKPTEGYESAELCSVETKSRLTFKLGPTVWPVGHLNLGLIQQTSDILLQPCYSGGVLFNPCVLRSTGDVVRDVPPRDFAKLKSCRI